MGRSQRSGEGEPQRDLGNVDRAWVQLSMGTSTTLHTRHLMGALRFVEPTADHVARASCFSMLSAPTIALPHFFLIRAFSVL